MTLSDKAVSNRDLMDRIYRTQRHIYDVTRKYYLLGRDRLIADLAPPPAGAVLEIGCGTGRNLIAAAKHYPGCRFYGVDISPSMLETARANIGRAGLAGRVQVAEADATGFDAADLFARAPFDLVFFSYSLSMIPDWEQAIDVGLRQLNPTGRLHVVDFGGQEKLPDWFKALLNAWLARFHVAPRKNLADVLEAAAQRRQGHTSLTQLYRGYSVLGMIALP